MIALNNFEDLIFVDACIDKLPAKTAKLMSLVSINIDE